MQFYKSNLQIMWQLDGIRHSCGSLAPKCTRINTRTPLWLILMIYHPNIVKVMTSPILKGENYVSELGFVWSSEHNPWINSRFCFVLNVQHGLSGYISFIYPFLVDDISEVAMYSHDWMNGMDTPKQYKTIRTQEKACNCSTPEMFGACCIVLRVFKCVDFKQSWGIDILVFPWVKFKVSR